MFFFLVLAQVAIFSAEKNHLYNYGIGHNEERL